MWRHNIRVSANSNIIYGDMKNILIHYRIKKTPSIQKRENDIYFGVE